MKPRTPLVPLSTARSFLFVPADRPERLARALASGADAVIVDLEDAVAPDRKADARDLLRRGFAELAAPQRARLLLRINASAMPWFSDDLALACELAREGLGGIVVPKAETGAELNAVADAAGPGVVLVPLVESARGLAHIDELAAARQVLRLAFGHLDFQADVGLACEADEAELVPVRLDIVLASRRAELAAPIDGVTADWHDTARLSAETARARRGGFGAKLCIHPQQVQTVHAGFAPSAAELAWARKVCDAAGAGGGVVNVDGKMVDAPVVRLAQRLLASSGA